MNQQVRKDDALPEGDEESGEGALHVDSGAMRARDARSAMS